VAAKGPWRRAGGVFRFERGPAWPEQPEYVLKRGTDAPLERRDVRFVVGVVAAIFLLGLVIALVANLVGWV
jgi:hypothetical protein